jgi:glycosyltransferase involved in cell wall biosynthesis
VTPGRRLGVLVVHPYPEPGGAGTWLLRLLDAARDRLELEAVLLADGPMRGELEKRGIPVEVRRVGRRPIEVAPAALWLARRLRRRQPDVVLGNILKAQLVAAPAGRLAGVPTVWAKHDHGYDRWLAVPLGRLSTEVIGAVEELAEPTRRADAVIIPPPRPERPPASRADAREHLRSAGIPVADAPVLVMAGRLVPFKGMDDAVRALALAPAAGWHLVSVGSDDHAAPGETERLRSLAARLGVTERVHFAGQVDQVSHWLAGFDALAVLTKPGFKGAPEKEGFGTSAFEAMVAGIPVVAVGGGAVVRRLEGRAGIGVPPGSPEAVAEALGRLSDPEVRRAAGEAGRALVADHPDLERCAEMLIDVLEAAAARRRGQRRRSISSS